MWTNIKIQSEEMLSWLVIHGFEPNNREWASLILLTVLVAITLSQSQRRSALASALKVAAGGKLVVLWLIYIGWIVLLTQIADQVGVWRPFLTKDTFIWGVTTGLVLLLDTTNASEYGFFRKKFFEIASVMAIFEYLMNIITFSIPLEIVLQIVLFIAVALPAVADESREHRIASRARNGTLTVLTVGILYHTITALSSSWQMINWRMFILKSIWPVLLGIWILLFIFPLAIFMGYEQAFIHIDRYPDTDINPWKAKLGLLLALSFRLKEIREAGKGGGITYDVAHSESICDAYREAKDYRSDLR